MAGTRERRLMERACTRCICYHEEWEGEGGGYLTTVMCAKHESYGNLSSFPFKKTMPCFQLDFWCSKYADLVDGTEASEDRAFAEYRAARDRGELKSVQADCTEGRT